MPAPSTVALTNYQWKKLVASFPTYEKPFMAFNNFDPRQVAWFIARTGAHPCVLADPRKHKLSIEPHEKGLTVVWNRPKNIKIRGLPETRIPLEDPNVVTWVEAFVNKLYQYQLTLSSINRSMHSLYKHSGVYVCARNLRHTFLAYVADKTHNPAAVQQLGNVSPLMALNYTKRAMTEEYREYFREAPPAPGRGN